MLLLEHLTDAPLAHLVESLQVAAQVARQRKGLLADVAPEGSLVGVAAEVVT